MSCGLLLFRLLPGEVWKALFGIRTYLHHGVACPQLSPARKHEAAWKGEWQRFRRLALPTQQKLNKGPFRELTLLQYQFHVHFYGFSAFQVVLIKPMRMTYEVRLCLSGSNLNPVTPFVIRLRNGELKPASMDLSPSFRTQRDLQPAVHPELSLQLSGGYYPKSSTRLKPTRR